MTETKNKTTDELAARYKKFPLFKMTLKTKVFLWLHRRLEDTMLYIHMHPENPRRYDVESFKVNDKEAISLKIAEGWELALQTLEEVYFKRPRWVP